MNLAFSDAAGSKVTPAPPSLIRSLTAGFDAISNHILLIVFPVLLDMLLWLGPHFSLKRLIIAFVEQTANVPEMQSPEASEVMSLSRELWLAVADRFNLLSLLRTYPVGVPSLMAGRSPVESPMAHMPAIVELPSLGWVIVFWAAIILAGLFLGTIYFSSVAQAALDTRIVWAQTIRRWPREALQVLLLALVWLGLLLLVGAPFSCLLSFLVLAGSGAGRFFLIVFGGLVIWMLIPLLFSPHGIFVHHQAVWPSVKKSATITRLTLPSTGLFILIVLVLSEGLDVLWNVPPDTSWWTFVAVVGHAFITTGLLAASFVYYRDADRWVQMSLARARKSLIS